MTSRRRNSAILALVAALLVLSALVIVPGSPLHKPTRLGLDLRGGVELIYQGQPTPQVPKVTPEAIDDAIETIRKRTDALGVAEPEIQRSGADQISVGLPDVQNAERAIQQVGTTAQLQFYDWEANVLGGRGPDQPYAGSRALWEAVRVASRQKPRAEPTDVPPEGVSPAVRRRFGGDRRKILEYYDRRNDSANARYYLFGPDRRLIQGPDTSCNELLSDYEPRPGAAKRYTPGTQCARELRALGAGGPPAGSVVVRVPQGILVVEAERAPNQPEQIKRYFVIEDDVELSGSDIRDPRQEFDPRTGEPVVTMRFSDRGRRAFERVTRRLAERGAQQILPPGAPRQTAFQRFAIVLDGRIISRATIDFVQNPEGIDGRTGAQIEGIGSLQEAQDLARNLRIGALPINLKLISQTQVSATLGKQALQQGLVAGLAGLGLTILFLVSFYRVLGVIATLALFVYAVLLFAVVKLIPVTLTLPGIAGLILTLGVAADANIVIYERIKEEVRAGRSIPAAISAGYSKALRTIVDANVVTLGVAFILFMLATAGVKGFAFTLLLGTLTSLFTAVLATSAVLGTLARSRLLARPSALGIGRRHVAWRFDFMGRSKLFFSMSGVIIAAGAIAISTLGINFGIDFEAGTRITTPLERPASVQQVRDTLAPLGYADAKIQQVRDPELGANVVQISTPRLAPDAVERVRERLDQRFGVRRADFSVNSIGPTFGKQVAETALIAILASLALISVYIAARFQPKFAVPVLIALVHDILITAGVYAITDREVTTATVAALLTILGYSLYDTIIVFDRIRENMPRMPRATFAQIANRSMSEVLTRSLATSLSTLLPITALYFFGGETLKDFAFALMVGVVSGTYSSIFIATPVLVEWKERESLFRRRRELWLAEYGRVPAFFDADLAPAATQTAASGAPSTARRRGGPAPAGAAAAGGAERSPGAVATATAAEPEASRPQPADPPLVSPAADAEREKRARRRSERKRKHGRPR
ncbi:protein translocase subunit SecD [Thermoleophilum album]|uniref:protein translocase subunit SecD n=1 Tax=Thermoleophilum album TaxID=29539 RepID=UPI00237D1223|nr:protein translocase subunit SecD [Thermoleophilum album]WDT92845.1 protein translocase subunit SecD [Thermoleophilum album]